MDSNYTVRLTADIANAIKTNLKFKSGDKGMTMRFVVDGLDASSATTAKIAFMRANNTSVEGILTASNGVYTYTIKGTEFAIPGMVRADLKFYTTAQRVSTASFIFEVISDTLDGFGGSADAYSESIEKAIAEAKKYAQDAQQAVVDVSDAEAYATGKRQGVDVGSTDPAYHNNAKWYSEQTGSSIQDAIDAASSASTSETNAATSAAAALASQNAAKTSEDNASASATSASASATNAATSETNAGTSATNAATSESNASTSASTASDKALEAEGYAKGTQNGTAVGSGSTYYHNNAKYWSEQAAAVATSSLGGLTDVDLDNVADGESLEYDGSKWMNRKSTYASKAKINVTIAASAWVADATYDDFGYKAEIAFSGIDSSYFADVVLSPTDAMSGKFAPVCSTDTNKVVIYASEVPDNSITVLAIKVAKVVSA